MKKDIDKRRGTIAYALNERMSEIEMYMQSPKQFPLLKEKVKDIIREAYLTNEMDREQALNVFDGIRNYNLFLSTFATYITGIKVS